ncbi:uncharacterized protein [Mytilus edulis]|uniref:uncharacterized protein isoform X23 n=1 Tax=Mytilus edulis TaxID=6550 RepID=UPI0039EE4B9E
MAARHGVFLLLLVIVIQTVASKGMLMFLLSASQRKVICEDSKTTLSCPWNQVIKITQATYGRSDKRTCKHPNMKTTRCVTKKPLGISRKNCNGRTSCTVAANNRLYGDPCPGTYKYVTVTYSCKVKKTPKCLRRCHKQAKCIRGKCVCKSGYKGDGIRSCTNIKESAYIGCYQDHSKRILPKDVLTDKSMTVQKCRQFCRKKGFKFAGVENGNECFCGDVLRKNKQRKEGDCKTPCSGNKQQICGGPWRISIYTAQTSKCRTKCHKKAKCRKGKCVCKGNYQGDGVKSCKKVKQSAYIGCYEDHSKRILPKDVLTDKSMTVQKCRQFCRKKGFKYAGVENGNECFCGDVLRKNKKKREGDCKTPCSGNKQQICGGPWRISIYTAQISKCRNKCHKKAKCRKGKCVCKGNYQGDGVKSCKKVKPSKRKVICEDSKTTLSCPSNQVIKITQATYGRSNKRTCKHPNMKTTRCVTKKPLGISRKNCNGRKSCTIAANNRLYGDPCPGTYKYVTVTYSCKVKKTPKCLKRCHRQAKCIRGKCVCKSGYKGDGIRSCTNIKAGKRKVICEDSKTTLSCPSNQVIKITQATYGRSNKRTCKHPNMKTTRCVTKKPLGISRKNCNGRKSCIVAANNRLYGDPCPGTYKYVTVTYSCKVKKTPKCLKRCHKQAKCIRGKCVCKSGYKGDGIRSCTNIKAKTPCKPKCQMGFVCNFLGKCRPKGCKRKCRINERCVRGKCRCKKGSHRTKLVACRTKIQCTPKCKRRLVCSSLVKCTKGCKRKCRINERCFKGKCRCTKGSFRTKLGTCKKSAYVGCYQDHSKRILPKDFLRDKSMTVQKCQQFCRKKGFKYAGVENGNECFCGDVLRKNKKRKEGDCKTPCSGNKQQICGGPWRISIYTAQTSKCRNKCHKKAKCRKGKCVCKGNYQGDGVKSCKKVKQSAYIGCYQDHSKRILPKDVLTDKSMTVQKCRQFCRKKGFKYAGVENGNECFCGDVLRKNKKKREGDCKTPCSGNKQQICGGPWRISIYTAQISKCRNKCHKKAKCRKGKCVCKGNYQGDGVKSCKKVKPSKRKVICEDSKTTLSCPSNQVIKITQATYGRSNKRTCKHPNMKTTRCVTKKPLGISRKNCNGRKSCTVAANNRLYGDPCPGTYKYVTVTYSCKVKKTPKCLKRCHRQAKCIRGKCVCKSGYKGDGIRSCTNIKAGKRKVICEDSKTTLSCPSNQVIKITQATYGRSNKRTCKHPNMKTNRCVTKKPLGISRKNCNGRKSCIVAANNRLYGDPCPGTYKYVTVTYSCKVKKTPKCLKRCHKQAKCIRGKCVCKSGYKGDGIRSCTNIKASKRKVICEDSKTTLSCPSNQVIKITQATYGRSNKRTCKHPNMKTTRCVTKKPLGISRKNCNGRKSCTVAANNRLYGDPCPGTYKYVTVTYSCKVKKTPKCLRRCHRQAKCIRGKCVCKSRYKGDGIRSCTNIKGCKRKCRIIERCVRGKCRCKKGSYRTKLGACRTKTPCKPKCQKGFVCNFRGKCRPKGCKRKCRINERCVRGKCRCTKGSYRTILGACRSCERKCKINERCFRGKCRCNKGLVRTKLGACKTKVPCKPKCKSGFVCSFRGKCRPKGCKRKCRLNERCDKGKCRCKKGSYRTTLRRCKPKTPCKPKCKSGFVCSFRGKCRPKACKRKCRINERCRKGKCRCKKGSLRTKLGTCKTMTPCKRKCKRGFVCNFRGKCKRKVTACKRKCRINERCRKGKCRCKKGSFRTKLGTCKTMTPCKRKCKRGFVCNFRGKCKRKVTACKRKCRINERCRKGKCRCKKGSFRTKLGTCKTMTPCKRKCKRGFVCNFRGKCKRKVTACKRKCRINERCRKGKCRCKKGSFRTKLGTCKTMTPCKRKCKRGFVCNFRGKCKRKVTACKRKCRINERCRKGKCRCKKGSFRTKLGTCKTMTPCTRKCKRGFVCNFRGKCKRKVTACKRKCRINERCRKGKCRCKKGSFRTKLGTCKTMTPCKRKCKRGFVCNFRGKCKRKVTACKRKCRINERCRKGKCRCKKGSFRTKLGTCKTMTPCKRKCKRGFVCNFRGKCKRKVTACKRKCRINERCRKGKCRCKKGSFRTKLGTCKTMTPCTRKCKRGFVCNFRGKCKRKVTACKRKCRINERCRKGKCRCKKGSFRTKLGTCKTMTPCTRKCKRGFVCNFRGKCKRKVTACKRKCRINERCRKGKCRCKKGSFRTKLGTCKTMTPCKRKCKRGFVCNFRGKCKRKVTACIRKCRINERCRKGKCRCKKGSFRTKLGTCKTMTPCKRKCKRGFVCNFRGKCKRKECKRKCRINERCVRGKYRCKKGSYRTKLGTCRTKTPCKPKCQKGFVCNFLGKCRPKGCKRKCRINERCVRGKCRCKKGSYRTKLGACRTKIQCTPKCKRGFVCSFLGKCRPKGCKRKCRINERCFNGKCRCTKGSFRTKLGTCKKRCNADSCGVNAVCVKRKDCRCKRGYAGHPKILCEEVKECLKNARGKDYNGRMSTTESGRTCQAWNKQTPHRHSKSNVRDAKNYCRNMDNEQRPWCYTTDSRKRWEFCRIPICENRVPILPPPEECRKSTKGTEYKGRISLTKTGRTCQYWERQYPHKHRFSISFKKEHNYCRNPDNSGQPWCYTNDPTTRWEYCQIPMCAPEDQEDVDECRKSTKGTEYKGRISLTKTGRTCQYWERQYPHKHRFSISFKKEHNYCRNPDNSGQPWCYTNDPTKRWEYCQIPMCAACSVREEIVECKATVRVSGSCFYKSKVGSSCVYTVQLTNSQAIIKTSTQEMVLTNGGNLAECAIFTFNDGTLKIEDDVCKCFEATVVNK